ncbi:MAG: aldehyde dehydrogenase family protein [Mesorhizobium sp.]|nr:aldehyde dehydrogenase family protein [Mesorhizobium sp.]MBL8575589.1 aldehyde dehydrogenase family protein [Mesorhizobium sp.]
MSLPVQNASVAPVPRKRMLIDGEWVEAASGRVFETYNPANGEHLADIAEGQKEDVDRAVAAARRAFENPLWRRARPTERQAILLRLADLLEENFEELARLDTLDMGMPITFSRSRKTRLLNFLRYYASLTVTQTGGETVQNSLAADIFTYTVKEPVGVVGAIMPWNSPLTQTIMKVGPVLASGCTVVLKPSEEASLAALRMGELFEKAGVPAGVVNIVTGFGKSVGAALADHPGVDKISFTGSNATGQRLIEASKGNLKRLTLELGGKSPHIIFADADLDAAVPVAAMACFSNSGQICSAGSRLLVERPIYDEFMQRVADYAKSLTIGDGLDPATQIGPIVSRTQFERIQTFIRRGLDEHLTFLAGMDPLDEPSLKTGHFIRPTVIAGADNSMKISREEIFGPVLVGMPFDSFDQAMQIANDTDFGLGAGVWTRSVSTAHQSARAIRSGTVWINTYAVLDPAVPFGGFKTSGIGREQGRHQLDAYFEEKSVYLNL